MQNQNLKVGQRRIYLYTYDLPVLCTHNQCRVYVTFEVYLNNMDEYYKSKEGKATIYEIALNGRNLSDYTHPSYYHIINRKDPKIELWEQTIKACAVWG